MWVNKALEFLKNQEKIEEWNLRLVAIEESAQKKGVENFDISDRIACTCFSDSIVISVKTNKNRVNEDTSTLIANIAKIGANLMTEGILLRGAIVIGKLIHSNNGIIMGQALIDAYELEQNVAGHARIIISKKLLDRLNYPIREKRHGYPYHEYLNRFDDGCVGFTQMMYFQVLQPWKEMDNKKMRKDLEKIRKVIVNGLDLNFQEPEIFKKYYWLMSQYNSLVIFTDGIKKDIHKLNDGLSRCNIHYNETDIHYNPTEQIQQ